MQPTGPSLFLIKSSPHAHTLSSSKAMAGIEAPAESDSSHED